MKNEFQIDALAGYLSAIDFTHFCTFTTRKEIGLGATRRIAEQVAVRIKALPPPKYETRDVNKWDPQYSPYPTYAQVPNSIDQSLFTAESTMFWAAEKFDVRDGYHFHALLSTRMHQTDIWDWYFNRFGRCQVINNTDDDRRHSAAYYCSKYITKSITDWDIYFSDEVKNRAQTDLYRVLNHYDRKV